MWYGLNWGCSVIADRFNCIAELLIARQKKWGMLSRVVPSCEDAAICIFTGGATLRFAFMANTVTCVQLDAVNLEKEQNFLKTGFFSRHRLVLSGCLAQMLLPQARGWLSWYSQPGAWPMANPNVWIKRKIDDRKKKLESSFWSKSSPVWVDSCGRDRKDLQVSPGQVWIWIPPDSCAQSSLIANSQFYMGCILPEDSSVSK